MSLISEDKEKPRSPQWPAVRDAFLKQHPNCELCGGEKVLNVHHLQPFHLRPDLELVQTNLITLCENKNDGVNCHLLFGHLGNFQSINIDCVKDVVEWHEKLKNRPK